MARRRKGRTVTGRKTIHIERHPVTQDFETVRYTVDDMKFVGDGRTRYRRHGLGHGEGIGTQSAREQQHHRAGRGTARLVVTVRNEGVSGACD